MQDTQVGYVVAPGGEAPPRNYGKIARGVLVSVVLVSCVTFGLHGTWHVDKESRAKEANLSGTSGSGKYQEVQYFGFNVFTSPGKTADGCFGVTEDAASCYLGNPSVVADIRQRANIMLKAIHSAHAAERVDHRSTTLKIFTAPEFYWRGPNGAYRIGHRLNGKSLGNSSSNHMKQVMLDMWHELSQPMFQDWVFVLGTFVMAEWAGNDANEDLALKPFERVSYYNFAPIHIGGTDQSYAEFKHYISSVDFLEQGGETNDAIPYAPGTRAGFCEKHPDSSGCKYGHPGPETLDNMGFGNHKSLDRCVFEVGGITIGVEICLDHKLGKMAEALGPARSVDVHVIVSEGMTIAMGPVCTRAGGPIFLNDGSARTEISLNQYGAGRRPVKLPNGNIRYELGLAYGADTLVAIQQWLGDVLVSFTKEDWGPRAPGEGSLPAGSIVDGLTGITFGRVLALGENWKQVIGGYYHTASYEKAQQVFDDLLKSEKVLEAQAHGTWVHDVETPLIAPTVDIYGPMPFLNNQEL